MSGDGGSRSSVEKPAFSPEELLGVATPPAPKSAPAEVTAERPAFRSHRSAPPDASPTSGLSPEVRVRGFLQGELNLAEMYALTHEELYEIADQGNRLVLSKRLGDAERVFEGLTALDPQNADFHAGLGAIYQQTRRPAEARREYDRAIQLHNGHVAALTNRAELSMADGKLEEALADLTAVVESDPSGTQAHSGRARALAKAAGKLLERQLAEQKG